MAKVKITLRSNKLGLFDVREGKHIFPDLFSHFGPLLAQKAMQEGNPDISQNKTLKKPKQRIQ